MSRNHNDDHDGLDENMHIFSIEEEAGDLTDDPVDLEEDAFEVFAASTGPDFETALESIQEESVEPGMLLGFSDMDRNQTRQLKKVWPTLPDEARHTIADHILMFGMDDVLQDFQRFYRLMIDDPMPEVRIVGANGLAMDEDENLIDPLLALLGSDPDTRVRVAAARALATYVTLGEFLELDEATVRKLRSGLMKIVTNDSLPAELRAASLASAAVQSGDKDIQRTIERFENAGDHELKMGAYQAMGNSGAKMWIKRLDIASRSNNAEIRGQVARSLGAFDAEAVPILTMMVREDTEADVRIDAIEALGRVGGKKAIESLNKLRTYVSDDERPVVEEAMNEAQEWAAIEALDTSFENESDDDFW